MAKKIKSLTTPDHKMAIKSYLAELVMVRQYSFSLPPYFWRYNKWKWEYTRTVQAIGKFIKNYGIDNVAKVIKANYISKIDYGNMEYLLQSELERQNRILKPKDISGVRAEVHSSCEDVREPRPLPVRKKGLFERMGEIEGNL